MAFTESDVRNVLDFENTSNLDAYLLDSTLFTDTKKYYLQICGEDSTGAFGTNSLGAPTTTNVAWTLIREHTVNKLGMRVYEGVPSSTAANTTAIAFPTVQESCYAKIIESDYIGETINDASDDGTGTYLKVTLPVSMAVGNLGLSFFTAESPHVWTKGEFWIDRSDPSPDAFTQGFAQSNNIRERTCEATQATASSFMIVIGFEVVFPGAGLPTITEVAIGDPVQDGDTNVRVDGTNFSAPNTVTISLVDDINDASAVDQGSLSSEVSTRVLVDVIDLPVGANSSDPIYVFITDSFGTDSAGFIHEVTELTEFPHAIKFDKECSSLLGFNVGMTAYKNKDHITDEVISVSITAVDTLPTITPHLLITWPDNLDAINGTDTLHIAYSKTVGDIKATEDDVELESVIFDSTGIMVCT